MNINLNLYKYFYNVAYYGSYTKASESLMISQPSLSYSVKVLESQLNKKLFVRGTKGIELTKYGKYLYDKLDVVFKELETIDEEDNDISGNITLGVRSAFAYKVLPFYINELSKIYPDLRIDFTVLTHEKMILPLENGEVDLVIDEYAYDNPFVSIKLEYCHEAVFITSKDSKIKTVTLDTLKNNEICLVETNQVSKEFEKNHLECKYIKVQSTPIMINKVKESDIIGLTPLALVSEELEKGDLVKLNTDIQLPQLNMYMTYRKGDKDKKLKAVIDFFQVHFGNYEKSFQKNS